MSASTGEPLSKRQVRHRKTEAVRRQRINTATNGMKQLLGLLSSSDQATVLEAAFEALKRLTAKDAACTCQYIDSLQLHASSTGSTYTTVDTVGAELAAKKPTRMPQQMMLCQETALAGLLPDDLELDFDLDMPDLLPDSPLSAAASSNSKSICADFDSASVASAPQNEFSACILSSLTAGSSVSLDSFFLKSTVAIFLNSDAFDFLDCNQAGLDILGAPSRQSYIDLDDSDSPCNEADMVIDGDIASTAMQQLAISDTVTSVQRIRRLDGSVVWIRALMTKVVHNGSTPGYLGIMQHVTAPVDGRAKVWTNDHLISVGQVGSHPPFVY
eukprot:m.26688 g.26688  ORF g.26688 m.26688 type:complete len:329 (+) comp11700_c0_seq1:81-1067(+)